MGWLQFESLPCEASLTATTTVFFRRGLPLQTFARNTMGTRTARANNFAVALLESRICTASSLVFPYHQAMVGTQLLHYKITRKLGAGGMGEVFEAEDLKLGRTVALKFVLEHISGDAQVIERFGREAKAVSRMDHPNVGSVFALEQSGDKTFLAMAYYQGETLRQHLDHQVRDHGRLNLNDAMRYSLEIARGLEHAHGQGVTHRDVKPANIFLSRTNNPGSNNAGVIKLLDFGLARLEDASRMMTTPGATTGTLMYMAPEQMRSQTIGHQVDVWAWGAVTFEMLAGRPPFVQENIGALLAAILSLEPDSLEDLCPDAPAGLIALVKHALRKNPAERIENTGLIVQELEAIISGAPTSSNALNAPVSRVEIPNLKPEILENNSSASDHPAFVSGSSWSNPNWSDSAAEIRVEPQVVTPPSIKPRGPKSALWLLAPVALVGIFAGGFGIMNSRLSQPIVQPSAIQTNTLPNVQTESSSQPVIASSSSNAVSNPAVKPKSVQSKPTPVKPAIEPAKTPTVPTEIKPPVAVVTEPARATFSTPQNPSNVTQSNTPSTPRVTTPTTQTKTTTISKPSSVAAKPAPVKPAPAKTVPEKPINNPSATLSAKPAATSVPDVNAAPKPPQAHDCKPLLQASAVLERVLIASGNTLPLMDCGSYFHAKGMASNEAYPEALEARREVIALPNGTVMIADAVHYADTRKPLGFMPLPADAKRVENADLNGGHQWRSEIEGITVNAMNLGYIQTKAVQTEGKATQLETSSGDDPGTDFVFLTVYQGQEEEISNLNVGGSDAHDRNFAGVLLNDETAIFLGPGANAKATNFEISVPPRIKTYLISGLEPGKSCKIGFEPDRNWWDISIKEGSDGTVNGAGVVLLETKAPTY
jgi:serine/threonine protein kinase